MYNEFITILMGALPISEVRGAIPLAIFGFGFEPLKAYLLAVLGNLLPILPVLFFLHYFSEYLMHKSYWINRFLSWLFQYTRERHEKHFAKREETHHHYHYLRDIGRFAALLIFVAVPLPLTGVWSGILAAFVFGLPFWRSALALALGVAAAGQIIMLIALGILSF
mgnify:CR=1 FL=1